MPDASSTTIQGREYGCRECWPDSPDDAWEARRSLGHQASLVDDSHLIVTILECRHCKQRFLDVFREFVDWVDGDDPQYWTTMPISTDEAAELLRPGESLPTGRMAPDRRSLERAYPKGEEPRSSWGTGISCW